MLAIKSSRFGGEYGERHRLLPGETVRREARIGLTISDSAAASRASEGLKEKKETTIKFDAVFARLISNVSLCHSHVIHDERAVYTDNSMHSLSARHPTAIEKVAEIYRAKIAQCTAEPRKTVHIADPVILTNNEGSGTWGHWVIQNFPKIALASAALPDFKIMWPGYGGAWRNFAELVRLHGIPESRMITVRPGCNYRIDRAAIVDFLYQWGGGIHPYAMRILDELSSAENVSASPPKRVLIRRVNKSTREITNDCDFARRMASAGFSELTLGVEPVPTQIATWRHASELCSIMGSDFTNIVFGNPGASILSITPAWFHDSFFFDLAAARGMVWNELICGRMEVERAPKTTSAFSIDEEALSRFLESYVRAGPIAG
jgi:capsular polysaccharide biosynthesis protein